MIRRFCLYCRQSRVWRHDHYYLTGRDRFNVHACTVCRKWLYVPDPDVLVEESDGQQLHQVDLRPVEQGPANAVGDAR